MGTIFVIALSWLMFFASIGEIAPVRNFLVRQAIQAQTQGFVSFTKVNQNLLKSAKKPENHRKL